MTPHAGLRSLASHARSVVDRVPEKPIRGSQRAFETSELRSTPGGGGVARARFLDYLNVEAQVLVGHLTQLVEGVADTLEVASGRDYAVNVPALVPLVRSVLELAGQLVWLLDGEITASGRARRYLVWYLSDLKSQRLLVGELENSPGVPDDVYQPLDDQEANLLAEIASAQWTARPTRRTAKGFEPAALLDGTSSEKMPKYVELVARVFNVSGTYALLSATSHSQRYGVMHGVNTTLDGRHQVGGALIDPGIVIGLAILGVNVPAQRLGDWAGVDTTALRRATAEVAPIIDFHQ